jgi:hypothetical protein
MATDYAGAVRNGSMAAARLHVEFDTKDKMKGQGGSVDAFGAALSVNLPLLLRPLKGLLGAYLPNPIPGVLVTTMRPLSIQRFTAAHEIGHFRMKHRPSLDDENILRRMTMSAVPTPADPDLQEIEADAFAVNFLMPRWLIHWHCHQQDSTWGELLSWSWAATYEVATITGMTFVDRIARIRIDCRRTRIRASGARFGRPELCTNNARACSQRQPPKLNRRLFPQPLLTQSAERTRDLFVAISQGRSNGPLQRFP